MKRPPLIIRAALALAALAGLSAILRRPRMAIALGFASHALLTSACVRRNSTTLVPLIKRFRTTEKEVWLTLDDGPGQNTEAFLEVLAKHQALASFFVIGKRADARRDLVQKIRSAGHSVENHTYSHPRFTFWTLPECTIRTEVERGNHAITTAGGEAPRFFRPPVGMSNPFLYRHLCANWLRPVGWSADGCDGLPGRDLRKAGEEILAQVQPGSIILFHEGSEPGRVEALDFLLTELGHRGYRCILPTNESL